MIFLVWLYIEFGVIITLAYRTCVQRWNEGLGETESRSDDVEDAECDALVAMI